MRLTYIRLLVNDFDSCFKFYSKTLKLKVTWGKIGDVYASFDAGDSTSLAIFSKELMLQSLNKESLIALSSPQHVLCFESDNVDKSYQELKELGVKFINEPKDIPGWGCRCVHLSDPEGNIIEINQELPKEKWAQDLLDDIPEN